MSATWCVECGSTDTDRWWIVADRMVCEPCAASVRSTFALAAALGISGVDLLMAVCDD